jgi:FMN phosphatase YigB (HAD superfamily)
MKTVYHVYSLDDSLEFFFDADGKLLHWWSENDATYNAEQMNPLFEALGVKIEEAEPNDDRFKQFLKEFLLEYGYQEDDVEYLIGD